MAIGPKSRTSVKSASNVPAQRPIIGLPVGEFMAGPKILLKKLVGLSDMLEIKAYPEPQWLPQAKPRAFHWNYGFVEDDFFDLFPLIGPELNGSLMFSADLGPAAKRRQGPFPVTRVLKPGEIEKTMGKAVELIRKYYSGPIGAENYNFYPTGLYEGVCEPDHIGSLLEKFDLFLVLDVAHALVSAHNLERPGWSYIRELPLDRVKEIHLSAPYVPAAKKYLAVDTHEPPGEREWTILKWLLKKIGSASPLIVIECYQSPEIVYESYSKLVEILNSMN
jgi:hypothetical protein